MRWRGHHLQVAMGAQVGKGRSTQASELARGERPWGDAAVMCLGQRLCSKPKRVRLGIREDDAKSSRAREECRGVLRGKRHSPRCGQILTKRDALPRPIEGGESRRVRCRSPRALSRDAQSETQKRKAEYQSSTHPRGGRPRGDALKSRSLAGGSLCLRRRLGQSSLRRYIR